MKELFKKIYLGLRKIALIFLFREARLPAIDPLGVDSVLVVRLDRIGDFVVSIPAIRSLKRSFPGARLTVLLSPACADLAGLVAEIDEIVVYKGFFSALRELKRRRFFLIIDLLLDYTLKTALLSRLAGAKVAAGFDIEGRGRLFNAALKPSAGLKPMSGYLLELIVFLAGLAGIKVDPAAREEPVLVLTPRIRESGRRFLREKGFPEGRPLLGIAPGAKYPSQCWKEEGFAVLADRLADKYKAGIIIIGSQAEGSKLNRIISAMRTKPIVASGLPLDKLAGVMADIKVLVSNNSGPLHLAAALGVATVSTMGPTVPHLWWPQGKNHIVIRRQFLCSPCDLAVCRRHECLESIGVEEMEEAVELLWRKI